MNKTKYLRRGNPGHDGSRAGRPKEKFTLWCQNVLHSPKVQKFLQDMAEGEPVDDRIIMGEGGVTVTVKASAPANARMKAIEFLAGYAHGKPAQELTLPEGTKFVVERPNA